MARITEEVNSIRKDEVKVTLHGKHFANINGLLWSFFKEAIGVEGQRDRGRKLEKWVNNQVQRDFDIVIKDSLDIDFFREFIRDKGYNTIAEWLREKVRAELRRSNIDGL